MKKYLAIVLMAAMACSLSACGGGTKPAETKAAEVKEESTAEAADYSALDPVEIVLADSSSKGAALQVFNELLAEKVSEITDGQLTIDVHSNGDLGGDADCIRQVQSGDIGIVGCQCATLMNFVPEVAIFDVPMAFSKYSGDVINNVLNGDSKTHAALTAAYEANDLHLLGYLQNATYRLTTSNKALNTLEDFAGLKIRTQENANHMAFWSAVGAEPTPLAWAEVYFALQTGTIEAQENAADTCAGANFNEVQSYLNCTNHILYCNQLCIGKALWDSLDPMYQAAMEQAMEAALAEMRPQLAQIDADNKKLLEDGGMTIITYEDSFFDEFLAVDGVQEVYKSIDESTNGLVTTLCEELAAQ